MNSSALTGVPYFGWRTANHCGIMPERAIAHMRREEPMRKAIHEVMMPARPPAMTILPMRAEPNIAATASAVARSRPTS